MTPHEIETVTFQTSRRGYERHQVDAFLARVAFAFRAMAHQYDIDWAVDPCLCHNHRGEVTAKARTEETTGLNNGSNA